MFQSKRVGNAVRGVKGKKTNCKNRGGKDSTDTPQIENPGGGDSLSKKILRKKKLWRG